VIHISNQSQHISVSGHPFLPPPSASHLRHTGHNGNDCKLLSSSKFHEEGRRRRRLQPALMRCLLTALIYCRAYVAMDADVQTAAKVTDDELCSSQQAAGDVETDGEMISEATGEADDNGQQPTPVTLSTALLCLDTVCAYLEMAGCDSYERMYGLIDQVHEIATKHSLQ